MPPPVQVSCVTVRMAVVDGEGRQHPSLVVRFILCLIVPAYHTVQAEMGW